MSIYNLLGIVNTIGIALIIAFNYKIRKESNKTGVGHPFFGEKRPSPKSGSASWVSCEPGW